MRSGDSVSVGCHRRAIFVGSDFGLSLFSKGEAEGTTSGYV